MSPCIGTYQEAVFFENYDIEKPIELWFKLNGNKKFNVDTIANLSLDEKILLLTSLETRQDRYKNQVSTPFVNDNEKDEILQRLKTVFTGKEDEQVHCKIDFSDEENKIVFSAIGISDVVKNDVVYELKFVSELSHEHFLQCACYIVALGLEKGILWNTRTNRKYEVKIPNKIQFLNSIARTVTKGYLKEYYNPTNTVPSVERKEPEQFKENQRYGMYQRVLDFKKILTAFSKNEKIESEYFKKIGEYASLPGIFKMRFRDSSHEPLQIFVEITFKLDTILCPSC